MEVKINYKGEVVKVGGSLIKGELSTYDYPGSPDRFEIEYIWFENVDIYPFVEDNLDTIESLTLEAI